MENKEKLLTDIIAFDEVNMQLMKIQRELSSTEEYKKLVAYDKNTKLIQDAVVVLLHEKEALESTLFALEKSVADTEKELTDTVHAVDDAQSLQEMNYYSNSVAALGNAIGSLEQTVKKVTSDLSVISSKVAKYTLDLQRSMVGKKRYREECNKQLEQRDDEIKLLKANITSLRKELPAEVAALYENIRLARKIPCVTMYAKDSKSCSACGTVLSNETILKIESKGIITCPHCGRILYHRGK